MKSIFSLYKFGSIGTWLWNSQSFALVSIIVEMDTIKMCRKEKRFQPCRDAGTNLVRITCLILNNCLFFMFCKYNIENYSVRIWEAYPISTRLNCCHAAKRFPCFTTGIYKAFLMCCLKRSEVKRLHSAQPSPSIALWKNEQNDVLSWKEHSRHKHFFPADPTIIIAGGFEAYL